MALIDDVMADITSLRSDAEAALTALAGFRPASYVPTPLAAPVLASVGTVTHAAVPIGPALHSIAPAVIGVAPTIDTTISAPGDAGNIDFLGGAIALPQFDNSSPVISTSGLFTWMEGTVEAIILSGGNNISAMVQDAVFNTGYERIMQTQRDALDLTGAKTGAKGCRYPNSMTKALQMQIISEFTWQRSDLGRQITKEMAEMAQRNLQAALSAGISLDDARARLATSVVNATTEYQRMSTDRYRAQVQANVSQFEGNLQSALAGVGIQKINKELQLAYLSAKREQIALEGKLSIDLFDAQTRAALQAADSSRSAFEAQSRIDLAHFDAEIRAEFMRVETDKMISELARSANEQLVRLFSAEVQQQVELQRANISSTQEDNRLAVGILESVAKSYIEIANSMSGQGVAVDITKH